MVSGCSRTLHQGTRFGCKGASEKSFGVPQCGSAWWRRTFDRFSTFFVKWSVFAVNVICLPFWRPKNKGFLAVSIVVSLKVMAGIHLTSLMFVVKKENSRFPSEIDSFQMRLYSMILFTARWIANSEGWCVRQRLQPWAKQASRHNNRYHIGDIVDVDELLHGCND